MVRPVTASSAVVPPGSTTALCRRLADRLEARGVRYPRDASVALAARGCRAQGPVEFARALGVDPVLLARIEAGEVPAGRWPATLVAAASATPDLQLAALGVEVPPRTR
jgi:hypothetical protein